MPPAGDGPPSDGSAIEEDSSMPSPAVSQCSGGTAPCERMVAREAAAAAAAATGEVGSDAAPSAAAALWYDDSSHVS